MPKRKSSSSSDSSNLIKLELTPNKAIKSVVASIGVKMPIMLWGPPGIGKSDCVRAAAKSLGRKVRDIRLPLYDPTDLKGMPYLDFEKKEMVWGKPSELPSDPESTDVILLDELSSANPSVQAAAYQLVLDRRVGDYVLPENVAIVAAGNRNGDRGVTYQMPSPLANRFIHINMKHSTDDWLNWAIDNKIDSSVIGYLSFSKIDLYNFDPKLQENSFCTPRSWSYVSRILSIPNLDDRTLENLIYGAIGEGVGTQFIGHKKIADQLPNPRDVLMGKVKKLENRDVAIQNSLAVSMAYEIKEISNENEEKNNNILKTAVSNYFSFIMENFETEFGIMCAKLIIEKYKIDDVIKINTIPSVMKFVGDNIKYINFGDVNVT